MPKPKKPTSAELTAAYVKDLTAVWRYTLKKHGEDEPYLFALYGLEGPLLAQLYPQVLTEKALAEAARKYVARGDYKSLEKAIDELRSSVADSPLLGEYEKVKMPTVAKLLKAAVGGLDECAGYRVLGKAAMAAFKQMDKAGVFGKFRAGKKKKKKKKKLQLEVITEGTEDDLWLTVDRKPRPKRKSNKWAELKAAEPFDETKDIAVTADGRRVYAVMRRDNPRPTSQDDRTLEHLAAFELVGTTLTRVWLRDLPVTTGRSARKLVITPDGRRLIVLLGQHSTVGVSWRTELMPVNAATGEAAASVFILSSPAAIGISPDGRHIAAATDGGSLVLFDPDLKPRHTLSLDVSANCLLFLRSSELLVGGDWTITRVDPETGKVIAELPFPGHRLSLSADETLLGASQRYAPGENKEEPFGAGVLSLPDFQLVQELERPGKQLLNAALSPDGRLLAFAARDPGTYESEVHVIDRASGATVLQREISMISKGFRFLPDSRRLIAINAGKEEGQSLMIWDVPP